MPWVYLLPLITILTDTSLTLLLRPEIILQSRPLLCHFKLTIPKVPKQERLSTWFIFRVLGWVYNYN